MSQTQIDPVLAEAQRKLRQVRETKGALTSLHSKIKLHDGQIILKQKLFADNVKLIWVQCGRNFGKTTFACYAGVRWMMLNPGHQVFLIGPEKTQMNEIVWHSGMLEGMVPESYYMNSDSQTFFKQESRARLKNGSFMKVDGADNPRSLRGIKGHLYLLDEFQDWKEDSWNAIEPNFAANDAPVIITGTPPDKECFYTELRRYVLQRISMGDRSYFYIERPTSTNPFIDRAWLAKKEQHLKDTGQYAIWLREYMAKFIPGGAAAVFPTFHNYKNLIVKSRQTILDMIHRDKRKLEYFAIYDPGTTTCFAVLFGAVNKYTSQIFILDEMYVRDSSLASTGQVWPLSVAKMEQYMEYDRWEKVYDEAGAWFVNEVSSQFGISDFQKTTKYHRDKNADISHIRDIIGKRGALNIAEECKNLVHEIENYVTNERGEIVKKKDHLIDGLRYLLAASNFSLLEDDSEPSREERLRKLRADDLLLDPEYNSTENYDYLTEGY